MRTTGNSLWLLLLLCLASTSQAAIVASLDRDSVALGDVLRLTITADGDEELSELDLRPLQSDFEVIQRSTSSNTSIINGKRSHTRQMLIDLAPRREGTLAIPAMRTGQHVTNSLTVEVGPAPEGLTEGQTVIFEAELDRESAYVQGQVILTLRLQQAINLEGRSISELQLDNAFVKPLEQESFQRNMGGRPWLVHEVRYAIFPEQSGTLVIPAQTFSARESQPRRSLFEIGGTGRLVRRTTQALEVEVLPRPAEFPDATWLPARKLSLEENWSTPPDQLRAGESATRTIRVVGEGLQGAQLPPVQLPATEGIKYYPDQPAISESEVASGLLGARQDSAALVPTREGTWEIPEIRIPWWDTEHGEIRYAVLPARTIEVAPPDPAQTSAAPPAADGVATLPATAGGGDVLPWQLATLACAVGWLLTAAYLLRSRRRPRPQALSGAAAASEEQAFKQLSSACSNGDSAAARQGIIQWAAALYPEGAIVSLEQAAAALDDDALRAELESLNAALYGSGDASWKGSELMKVMKRLRKEQRKRGVESTPRLELYPQPG
jgi:hypothetical protein